MKKLAVIGGGSMGGSVVMGLIKSGKFMSDEIIVADPDLIKLMEFKEKGIAVTSDNKEAVEGAEMIIIAVKPWLLEDVIKEIEPKINKASVILGVIVAGVSSSGLLEMFENPKPRNLSIIMPNTAISVGESMTFIVSVEGDSREMLEIFSLMGDVKKIPERQLGAATALASCGIAFALRYIRAACEGGVELGFPAEEAKKIVVQTLKGATSLLTIPGAHPEKEIDKVTTPGGITIKGLNAMEREGFTNAVIEGLKATII